MACSAVDGSDTCRCLTQAQVDSITAGITYAVIGGTQYSAFSAPNPTYPSSYGMGCGIHDIGLQPYCVR